MFDRIFCLSGAVLLGSIVILPIVLEVSRFLDEKEKAEAEGKDVEISGGMQNVVNRAWLTMLFVFTVFLHRTLSVFVKGFTLNPLISISAGFVLLFFVFCLLSVPIAYVVLWGRRIAGKVKQNRKPV